MKPVTKYIEIARKEAEKSPQLHRHGCVAMNSRGRFLTATHNRYWEKVSREVCQ